MTERLIIYHGGCNDGFTAAWAALRDPEWAKAEIYPATYGEPPPPKVIGRHVLIVDFSYPREKLLAAAEQAQSLHVYDHHKTAQADLEGLDFCTFDMERSGAGLAADYLNGGGRNWLIDAVEDRDLWRFALEDTREIVAALSSLPHDLDLWDAFLQDGRVSAAERGSGILAYIATYNDKALAQAHQGCVAGQLVPVVNVPYASASDCADLLLERNPEASFAGSYFRLADGRWQFSLRSRDDREDVSAVAQHYGGGGHRNASGFTVDSLPWE